MDRFPSRPSSREKRQGLGPDCDNHTSTTMSQSALLIGATGLIGKLILPVLVSSTSKFSRVGEFGRRVTTDLAVADKTKLVQKAIDFEKIGEAGMKDESWDVVYITYAASLRVTPSLES